MIKSMALQSVILLGLTCTTAPIMADEMVNPEGGVVVGYWHNWCDGAGYKGGNAPCVTLKEVNPMYNVVNVSFMKVFDSGEGRIPTFRLDPMIGLSEQAFIDEIAELNKQGRAVLIALGGADAHVELKIGDEQAFAAEIIRLTDRFGFDGLDIDLEQSAVTASDNQTVIPAALRIVKDHYAAQGQNFLITMAPEFPYLTTGGKYVPYLTALEGYYDWINPQFYNQGGDGIWIDGLGWIAQNNDSLKQEFIYYISDSLVNGTRGFHKIPHDKLVFGIPSSIDAAATGFIQDPNKLYAAFNDLRSQGQPLRGVMTWSVNWDMGTNAAGQQYNESFINDYGPFIHSQTPPPPAEGQPVFAGVTDSRIRNGNPFNPMAGITATDKEDGDLTFSIIVDGTVDTQRIGQYVLVYSVTDTDGNQTMASRNVEVYSLKPVFDGVDDTSVKIGTTFNPLAGITVIDAEDGDLTDQMHIEGEVNTAIVGVYTLTYTVTDSANQTVTASRQVTVSDGNVCAKDWDRNAVYNDGDTVTHKGKTWRAEWWTQGHEPGTTGEWGVWRPASNSDCGGGEIPQDDTLTLSGINSQYTADQGNLTLTLQLETSSSMTVYVNVTDAMGNAVTGGDASLSMNGRQSVTLELTGLDAGQHRIMATGETSMGETLNQTASFNVKDGGSITPPPGGEHPDYVAGTAYSEGDIVTGSDGNLYQCKPWPYSGWCASGSYAPGTSLYWADAWDKL
ncbi:immunoglobulin-like domain-containing protein [Photobacterium nomapromontoriensis]|uniref:immunoglobulin-like domain-containing protein n=1 Tax=Photobacterium nomapromontoriensis TaxID=2910237 RepID=UPI003D12B1D2